MNCPACNGTEHTQHEKYPLVYTCGACGALHGTVNQNQFTTLVKQQFAPADADSNNQRPYDFDLIWFGGVQRLHGWYDITTGLTTQIG